MELAAWIGIPASGCLVAVVGLLVATARGGSSVWLSRARGGLTLGLAGLTAATSGMGSPAWLRAVSVLAFLLALDSLALAFAMPRPLSHWANAADPQGAPAWWPSFERAFRAHVARERCDPIRRAVTRDTGSPRRPGAWR
jgi:hypothetical protein